jgi:hypothetical protein
MGLGDAPLCHRGDSMSALSWTQRGTVRSDVAIPAAFMWALFVSSHQTDVVAVDHISHERNSRADILSRSGSWTDVLREDKLRYGGSLPSELPFLDLACQPLLQLCNPRRDIDSDLKFVSFFKEGLSTFRSLADSR